MISQYFGSFSCGPADPGHPDGQQARLKPLSNAGGSIASGGRGSCHVVLWVSRQTVEQQKSLGPVFCLNS